jgi:hypothetical protein
MGKVTEKIKIKAPAKAVWAHIGEFDALHKWHPLVATCAAEKKGGDRFRRLGLKDGATIVERLLKHDDKARSYSYAMVDMGPLPLAKYQATITVTESPDGGSSQVEWVGTFEPKGQPPEAVSGLVSTIYTAGFGNLAQKFGAV